jgi:hypothetical protein
MKPKVKAPEKSGAFAYAQSQEISNFQSSSNQLTLEQSL